jgi:hypothetical protein
VKRSIHGTPLSIFSSLNTRTLSHPLFKALESQTQTKKENPSREERETHTTTASTRNMLSPEDP